jgi:hypothetical protein
VKLVDEHGFLLGTFTLPDGMTRILERENSLRGLCDFPPVDFRELPDPTENLTRRAWQLSPCHRSPPHSGEFVLYGIELSEFERLRYVEFSPSLAYVLKRISDFPR